MRQAFAGMLWSKQLFNYDVARWLDGDPTQPAPPASRLTGRNSRWRSFDAFDIMSMPDKWEYPWFAAWDLAFHCVALAHVDPAFAKYQMILICREWFQHPNGALPAYEWSFDDVNPPVQAWAALEVFAIDGARDVEFLRRVFDKLLVNFTWWVNREDVDGNNLFEGGFLGLDNIGPIDRDHLPVAGTLQQSDATAWMALYSLHMATMSSVLRAHGQPTQDLTIKFLEHFSLIRRALDEQGLWDEDDGFFYDRIVMADGTCVPIKVRSMVGVLPVLASVVVDEVLIGRAETLGKAFAAMLNRDSFDIAAMAEHGLVRGGPGDRRLLLGVVDLDKVTRLFERLFAEDEFLSPFGLRGLSKAHRDCPLRARDRRPPREHRLRAGRVDHRHVRGELELAGADLVPAQLPARQLDQELRELLRRLVHRRVPDRVRSRRAFSPTWPRTCAPAWCRSSCSARTVGGPATARPSGSGRTRAGGTTSSSTSTSTATTAPGSGASHQTGWTGRGRRPDPAPPGLGHRLARRPAAPSPAQGQGMTGHRRSWGDCPMTAAPSRPYGSVNIPGRLQGSRHGTGRR